MIRREFAYQRPSPEAVLAIQELRAAYSRLADALDAASLGPSREFALAKTHLEESAMWAVKSIVHNDPETVV